MKRLAAITFFVLVFGVTTFAQAPSLTITCETAGLPCDLFYGNVRVKPVRLRPPGTPSQYWCIGAPGSAITIDDCDFFIQQQYIDFLKRFPEPSCPPGQCGLDFYVPIIAGCNPNDTECIKFTRGALSANFFRSPEFRGKGAYVANLYNVTIGHRPTTVQELSTDNVDRPHYAEFFTDLTSITAPTDTETNTKKDQLAVAFLQRSDVQHNIGLDTNPGMTTQQFVQRLETIAGVTLANESTLINSGMTRAQLLRAVAESSEVFNKFDKPNFVTMEYFGYLRRDPEDCHTAPDPSQCGFIFHNNRFNLNPDPNVIQNIIVRGFIESPEYRNRF
jgi:hypothetical protein